MTKILVTGGSGYIGGATARALRAAGHQVYALTRSAAAGNDLAKAEIIPVIGDIDSVDVKEYAIIVDTASGGSVADGKVSLGLAGKVAAWNTSNPLLKKRYIYTGGCMTYSDSPNELLTEEVPTNPTYWRTPVEKEILGHGFTIVRPGWVYGESGGNYASPWFCISSPTADIEVKGKPEKMWSWVHIQDLAAAFVLVAGAPANVTAGQIYNVGDDTRLTFAQVRELMARAAGSTGKVVVTPADTPVERTCVMDTQKIRRQLGWRPVHGSFADQMPLYFAAWKAHQLAGVVTKPASPASSTSGGH